MEALTSKQLSFLLGPDRYCEPWENRPRIKSIVRALKRMNCEDNAYLIFNEFGLLSIATGRCEQDALDNAVDNDALDSCLVPYDQLEPEQVEQWNNGEFIDDLTHLGNAGELFDLQYISMREI